MTHCAPPDLTADAVNFWDFFTTFDTFLVHWTFLTDCSAQKICWKIQRLATLWSAARHQPCTASLETINLEFLDRGFGEINLIIQLFMRNRGSVTWKICIKNMSRLTTRRSIAGRSTDLGRSKINDLRLWFKISKIAWHQLQCKNCILIWTFCPIWS